jgi:predicted transcriptional regulator of viral defense system
VCEVSKTTRQSAHKVVARREKPDRNKLYRIAEQQAGYFTSGQAAEVGFDRKLLWHYQKTGQILRASYAIYRLAHFPASPYEDLFIAWLQCGPRAAISHESALALYNLSDVLPAEVHVTVPRTASRRRKGIRQHTNRLRPSAVRKREGLPVTSVQRTISDVAKAGLGEEQIREAIQQAVERGLTDRTSLLAEAKRRGGRAGRLIGKYTAEETPD